MIRIRFHGLAFASQPGGTFRRAPLEIAARHLFRCAAERKGCFTADASAWKDDLSACGVFAGLLLSPGAEACMVPFFIQIKCQLGKSYDVANRLADAEIASEIYSTAGEFDLLCKFYVDEKTDIGHFVNEKVQVIPGIQDTRTIITFKAF
jgi:DNA-binding Lrp family transcriptional regulator